MEQERSDHSPLGECRYHDCPADVGARLKKETKQRQPFGGLEEEVHLNILRAGDAFLHTQEETLKPAGLTPTQSNVLRILRAIGTWGLPCREIAGRMLTRDPDITRLPSA